MMATISVRMPKHELDRQLAAARAEGVREGALQALDKSIAEFTLYKEKHDPIWYIEILEDLRSDYAGENDER